ncbi:hypothetical protein C8D87_105284 [Lentzea atacamensis]|uniref:Nucleotidyl transferase AbiEii toxin, Type IV TA system n=1 Tax=Lentzea atacamensis TaxID=531938 RepID=A0ABX9E6E9_9PSEU|nr:hypothetical protein C8D87_105284 [Lentzea atacamensis]
MQLIPLLRLLHDRGVDWVLSGSAVLALYGADLRPNDLDVVPSPDPGNLRRLADLLVELEAVPAHEPSWSKALTRQECLQWRPDPPTAEQLDHLFVTRLGMVDVTPKLTGTYAELRPDASSVQVEGVPVRVCSPEEVLRRLPDAPRPKDVERAEQYVIVRDAVRRGQKPRATQLHDAGPISDR